MPYLARVMDTELQATLASAGAVLLEGPKASGKTATARQVAASEVPLDVSPQARQAAAIDPLLVLDGPTPRLIDEWQLEPAIWNHVRRLVDERGRSGQFILTGSSVPVDDMTRHVGAGRIVRLRMRPMTLVEAGYVPGGVSLGALLAGEEPRAPDPGVSIPRLADLVAVGGWPTNVGSSPSEAQRLLRGYLQEVARTDVRRLDGMRRDPQTVIRVLRSYARNIGTRTPTSGITADVNGAEGTTKAETIASYVDALARLWVVEDVPAWAPSLRSRTRLRAAPVRHFVDPSLAVAAVSGSPARLLADLNWMGFLFEGLVIRDLRVYAQALGAEIFAYRDETELEADAILEMADGSWAAFEVKLGASSVDAAAAQLLRVRERVDLPSPKLLAVITGNGFAYRRDDGVSVIPIGALGA